MKEFETRLWQSGVDVVAGVDEVGRGCLAGPVVAAAVALPPGVELPEIDDSKKLDSELRERLNELIVERALCTAVAVVGVPEIDELNILQASMLAMRQALERLSPVPERVLVDGARQAGSPFPETAIIGGDALSVSIAAASIVAKVCRDRIMVDYDSHYPHYGFASHKGYASARHQAALREHGPCPLHRRTFEPVAEHFRPPASAEYSRLQETLASCRSEEELEQWLQSREDEVEALGDHEDAQLAAATRQRRRALRQTGVRGEQLAAEYLLGRGYRLVERNYRGGGGEIDLIARSRGLLVFVEVKASASASDYAPETRVGAHKQSRVARAARHYIRRRGMPRRCEARFDVIAVVIRDDGEGADITHIEDAFQSSPFFSL